MNILIKLEIIAFCIRTQRSFRVIDPETARNLSAGSRRSESRASRRDRGAEGHALGPHLNAFPSRVRRGQLRVRASE